MEKIEQVERFCNLVPKVLIDDITQALGSQFLSTIIDAPEIKLRPSLCRTKRFHASLLYVDISGFTVLSQRLPVDEFKSHINNYFTKILDIVDKYEGCVVKFAGDALFVNFQSSAQREENHNSYDSTEEQEARKDATKLAVQCGVEILEKCSNHRIDFSHYQNTNFDSISSIVLSPIHRENDDPFHKLDHSFLNVHAGASEGMLLSMDIGAANRWEYFILGQPITDVADAEAVASKGELVISHSAHAMICGSETADDDTISTEQDEGAERGSKSNAPRLTLEDANSIEDMSHILPCGCTKMFNGCYRINITKFSTTPTTHYPYSNKTPRRQNETGTAENSVDGNVNFPHYENLIAKVNTVFEANKALMIMKYKLFAERALNYNIDLLSNNDDLLVENILYTQFTHWAITCFADDIARHVHESDRSSFHFSDLPRQDQIKELISKTPALIKVLSPLVRESGNNFVTKMRHLSRFSIEMLDRSSIALQSSPENSTHSTRRSVINNGHNSGNHNGSISSHSSHNGSISINNDNNNSSSNNINNGGLSGELRKVIVMFVNLKSATNELTFDMHADVTRDELLLSKFQSCIEVLISALHESGGQLRQFIVDDKGTVAIGSFGLRGSSNYDNAAAAVEAAQRIIDGLQLISVDCGIGLTSGRAYCGLVGSTTRNEYAIMGPSTNLSARLMGKANMGEILCDEAIKNSDRSHDLIPHGTITAKGYAAPVAIFKPDFHNDNNRQDGAEHNNKRGIRANRNIETPSNDHSGSSNSAEPTTPNMLANIAIFEAAREAQITPGNVKRASQMIVGRDYELQETYEFLAMSFVTSNAAKEPLVEFLTNALSTHTDHSLVFSEEHYLTSPTRMVIFDGESGIGKTTILRAVKRSFLRLSKRLEAAITIMYARSSSYRAWDPFVAIKPIIRKLLVRLATLCASTKEPYSPMMATNNAIVSTTNSLKQLQQDDAIKLTPHDRMVLEGVDFLSELLTDEMKLLLPLMTFANIVKGIPENDVTCLLEGENKLHKCEDLFIAFINSFVALTQNKVMIFFDDSQFMDNYTWSLVEKIWMSCSGVIVVTTFSRGEGAHMKIREDFCSGHAFKTDRILKVQLQSLSKEAVRDIAQGYFLARGLDEVDNEVYIKINEFSGGNPLYVQEITQAIIDKSEAKIVEINDYQQVDQEKMAEQICSNENFFHEILTTFNSTYLEEIIYYRFDKLSVTQQMVLKVAAVISEYAGDFTLPYLLSIFEQNPSITDSLYANQHHRVKEDQMNLITTSMKLDILLAKTLFRILEMYEFIQNAESGRRSSNSLASETETNYGDSRKGGGNITQTDEDILLDMQYSVFAFKVPLERKAIQDLLLDEQKLLMHAQAGHWLAERNAAKGESFLSARDVHSEAQHWEQAKQWPLALSAYHKAGMIVHRAGGTTDAVQIMASSYRMLTLLQEEAGVTDRLDYGDVTFDLIYEQVKEVEDTRGSRTPCPDRYWEKKMLMYRIFRGDATLLEETIEMVMHFGQMSVVHLYNNRDIVLRLYDLVMAIVVLTRPRLGFPDHLQEECPQLENFGNKDYPGFFAVLFGYVLVARFSGTSDLQTERTIGNIILAAATAGHEDSSYHRLPAWSILNSVAITEGKLDEFIETGELMIKFYSPKVHPALLIASYGSDMIPFSIVRYGQRLWSCGLFLRANAVMDYVVQHMKEVTHVMSLAKLAIFLTSLFTLHSRYTLSISVFKHYVASDEIPGGQSFFKAVNPLYFEYCKNKSKLAVPIKSYEPLSELQEQIAAGLYFTNEQRARPMVFDALSMYGAGVEMPCADMLATKAMEWLEYASNYLPQGSTQFTEILKEAERILVVALEYTEHGLITYNNDVLYPTPYIGLRKLCLYIHHTLYRCYKMLGDTEKAAKAHANSVQSVRSTIRTIRKLHYPFFLVMMGNYIDQEKIDVELGKRTAQEGLSRIFENNRQEDRLPALQFLTESLPQLKGCVQTWLAEYEASSPSSAAVAVVDKKK